MTHTTPHQARELAYLVGRDGLTHVPNVLRGLADQLEAVTAERDAWKARYLQVSAQTAHAEDRAEASEQALEAANRDMNIASVGEIGAQSANRHLSALVDFERQVSARCMDVMKTMMQTATPIDGEGMDCHIPGADYAEFVNSHAELLYVIKNGERPAPATQSEAAEDAIAKEAK